MLDIKTKYCLAKNLTITIAKNKKFHVQKILFCFLILTLPKTGAI